MRLVTIGSGNGFETGVQDDDGGVYRLTPLLEQVDGLPHGSPSILDLLDSWDVYRPHVLEVGERIGAFQPDPSLEVIVPFPHPRRDAFAIGGNYQKHVDAAASTTGLELKKRKGAAFFVKPTGSFVGATGDIVFDPDYTQAVDYEVELAVVMGRGGRDIPVETAIDHVFGFMVANDVTARDQMLRNKPIIDYFRGKAPDTFFPMGPGVTPREWAPDHRDMQLRLWVNGELRQSDSTSEMIRGVAEVIAELSRSLSLRAGDIVATGTPSGVAVEMDEPRWLQDGDLVEAEIEGLGRLANRVTARAAGGV
jgi:2-keto-4-pentenoate hydratase/2-oxohepta-3-ene-1,7-dioic acid hydratase in catechol pathway